MPYKQFETRVIGNEMFLRLSLSGPGEPTKSGRLNLNHTDPSTWERLSYDGRKIAVKLVVVEVLPKGGSYGAR